MHIPRFLVAPPLVAGGHLPLPPAQAHHALRVLRLREGDAVVVFDGSGAECPGQLQVLGRDQAAVQLGLPVWPAVESPLPVWLGQGLSQADKFDWVLQKAVELGVSAFTPLSLMRCVVRLDAGRQARRHEHWQGVAAAAAEQCGRVRVPVVEAPSRLDTWIARLPAASLRLRLDPAAVTPLATQRIPPEGVVLAIGPEGGFDPAESAALDVAGFQGVCLGPRVLRTETAALAALAVLQAWHGDFRPAGSVQAL